MAFPDVPPAGWTNTFGDIVQHQLAPVVARVDSLETSMQNVQQRVSDLEARPATAASSTKHVSTYVDIKGFCEYDKRDKEGVSCDLVTALFRLLKATLPGDAQDNLGASAFQSSRGRTPSASRS